MSRRGGPGTRAAADKCNDSISGALRSSGHAARRCRKPLILLGTPGPESPVAAIGAHASGAGVLRQPRPWFRVAPWLAGGGRDGLVRIAGHCGDGGQLLA